MLLKFITFTHILHYIANQNYSGMSDIIFNISISDLSWSTWSLRSLDLSDISYIIYFDCSNCSIMQNYVVDLHQFLKVVKCYLNFKVMIILKLSYNTSLKSSWLLYCFSLVSITKAYWCWLRLSPEAIILIVIFFTSSKRDNYWEQCKTYI